MPNAIFQPPKGLGWSVRKRPTWSSEVQTATSGRQVRAAFYSYPIWEYEMVWSYLRGGEQSAVNTYNDLEALMGFYMARQGGFDSFLYSDPNDNSVAMEILAAAGDGATTAFQLTRTIGSGNDIVQNVDGTGLPPLSGLPQPVVYKYNWQAIKNLCLQSESLGSSPWGSSGLSGAPVPIVTNNYGFAPNGCNTAAKIQFTNTGGSAYVNQNVSPAPGNQNIGNRTWTFSIWLKVDPGANSTGCRLVLQEGASPFTTSAVNLPTLSSTWQRYTVTLTMGSSSATTVNALVTNDNGGAVPFVAYAWGAQVEEAATASSYQMTAANNWGPLYQYPGTRTNLLEYSQDFTQSVWVKGGTGSSVSGGQSAPDGSTNADSFNSGTTDSFLIQSLGSVSNVLYTFSLWMRVTSGTLSTYLTLRNTAGTITYAQNSITVTTKWKRFTVMGTATDGTIQAIIAGFNTYISSSTTLQLFAGQLENWGPNTPGGYPWGGGGTGVDGGTSYIATTTTAASVIDYTLGTTGIITFASPPAAGVPLAWTGNYFFRLRFAEDNMDFEQFMYQLWELKSVKLESVIL